MDATLLGRLCHFVPPLVLILRTILRKENVFGFLFFSVALQLEE